MHIISSTAGMLFLSFVVGIRSLIGLLYIHIARDYLVSLSGVLRYCKIAFWNPSTFNVPPGPTL